jgi:hypothetical protein
MRTTAIPAARSGSSRCHAFSTSRADVSVEAVGDEEAGERVGDEQATVGCGRPCEQFGEFGGLELPFGVCEVDEFLDLLLGDA